jgi:hypothetical protein
LGLLGWQRFCADLGFVKDSEKMGCVFGISVVDEFNQVLESC